MDIPTLPDTMRDAMRRKVNRGLMVTWINRDLTSRAANDVRTSQVFYDEAGLFTIAFTAAQWDGLTTEQRDTLSNVLHDNFDIRYTSKGI